MKSVTMKTASYAYFYHLDMPSRDRLILFSDQKIPNMFTALS